MRDLDPWNNASPERRRFILTRIVEPAHVGEPLWPLFLLPIVIAGILFAIIAGAV